MFVIKENTSESSFDVDYDFNPTILYKLIESQKWIAVVGRVKRQPGEAATWVSRRKKNGSLRWKLLPLHAALCIKAPNEVILEILKANPRAASLTDDQGKLPLHVACKNADTIDDTVMKALIDANPNGLFMKDSRGRIPIQMKGTSFLTCLQSMLDIERENACDEQKALYEANLKLERQFSMNYILEIKEEFDKLSNFIAMQGEELREIIDVENNIKCKIEAQQDNSKHLELEEALQVASCTILELQKELKLKDLEMKTQKLLENDVKNEIEAQQEENTKNLKIEKVVQAASYTILQLQRELKLKDEEIKNHKLLENNAKCKVEAQQEENSESPEFEKEIQVATDTIQQLQEELKVKDEEMKAQKLRMYKQEENFKYLLSNLKSITAE